MIISTIPSSPFGLFSFVECVILKVKHIGRRFKNGCGGSLRCCVFFVSMQDPRIYVDVSKNRGFYHPKSSILIGFSIINHPFWGFYPYFLGWHPGGGFKYFVLSPSTWGNDPIFTSIFWKKGLVQPPTRGWIEMGGYLVGLYPIKFDMDTQNHRLEKLKVLREHLRLLW